MKNPQNQYLEEHNRANEQLEKDYNEKVDLLYKAQEEVNSLKKQIEQQSQHHIQELTYLKHELKDIKNKYNTNKSQLENQNKGLQKLTYENEVLTEQSNQLNNNIKLLEEKYSSQLSKRDSMISQREAKINEQKDEIIKNNKKISFLESRINDLSYELKTILELKDVENSINRTQWKPLKNIPSSETLNYSTYNAKQELKKCINIAEDIKGANYLNNKNTNSVAMQFSNSIYDIRSLNEYYRNINTCIVIYSPKEDKLLFANRHVSELTGWPTERFLNDFYKLIQTNITDWRECIQSIKQNHYESIRLNIKSKTGKSSIIDCHLGLISKGAFENNIVGVLYSAI